VIAINSLMNRQLADDVSHIDLELCIVELGLKRTFVFFFPSCRVSLLYHFAEQLQTSKKAKTNMEV
jgi:hypothetical protein